MGTTYLQSTLNKAKEQFENGHAKACVETLKEVLCDLKVGEPDAAAGRHFDISRPGHRLQRQLGWGEIDIR